MRTLILSLLLVGCIPAKSDEVLPVIVEPDRGSDDEAPDDFESDARRCGPGCQCSIAGCRCGESRTPEAASEEPRSVQKIAAPKVRVVVITSEGCAPCEQMKRYSLPVPGVEVQDWFQSDLVAKHGVGMVPATLRFQGGVLTDKIVGFVNRDKLQELTRAR